MSMEIVSRLLKSHKTSKNSIQESLKYKKLNEAGEDDDLMPDDFDDENIEFDDGNPENQYDEENNDFEDEENNDFEDEEFRDEENNSTSGGHSLSSPPMDGETHEDEYTDPDSIADEHLENKSNNPLDNEYASNYQLGQEVSLTYSDGKASKLVGIIDGYDQEGFYRVKWGNGMTTSGITDMALADFIGGKGTLKENKCLCGCKKFVNENKNLVCDRCGRIIKEFTDPLTRADRARPKGKRLVRSEAHPVNTSHPSSNPIGESIKKALLRKRSSK